MILDSFLYLGFDKVLTVALIDPQIPPNTGNIARLCGATNTHLDIVGSIGFSLDDKHLKRAGLDYWEHVAWTYHADKWGYLSELDQDRSHFFSSKGPTVYTDRRYQSDDVLVFGSETTGIGLDYLQTVWSNCCTIPMSNPYIRSLNLATSVGIGLYEAIRQINS